MMFHVLVEGTSDEPTVDEILRRRFGMVRGSQFQVHPHGGKGQLPASLDAVPATTERTLLGLLPATLRAFGKQGGDICVVVLVDQDDDDCHLLKQSLVRAWQHVNPRPAKVLFRIAMEETESWFLADRKAVRQAYSRTNWRLVPKLPPDEIDDPSDVLAHVLGAPLPCTGMDKAEWAKRIAPKLNLEKPKSRSLAAFVAGLAQHWAIP